MPVIRITSSAFIYKGITARCSISTLNGVEVNLNRPFPSWCCWPRQCQESLVSDAAVHKNQNRKMYHGSHIHEDVLKNATYKTLSSASSSSFHSYDTSEARSQIGWVHARSRPVEDACPQSTAATLFRLHGTTWATSSSTNFQSLRWSSSTSLDRSSVTWMINGGRSYLGGRGRCNSRRLRSHIADTFRNIHNRA